MRRIVSGLVMVSVMGVTATMVAAQEQNRPANQNAPATAAPQTPAPATSHRRKSPRPSG